MAVKELLVEIKVKIDKAKQQLKDFSDKVKSTGKQSIDASKEVDKLTKSTQDVGNQANDSAKRVDKLNQAAQNAGASAQRSAESVTDYSASAGKATTNTNTLTNSVKNMIRPLDDVKNAMGAITGVLGAFGVSVGVSQLITQIKQIQDESKKAHDEIVKLHQTMEYKYNLTEEQNNIVKRISSVEYGEIGYAGNPEDLTKIVGAVATLNKGASVDQIEKLSKTYMYFSEMGIGSLDTTVKEANRVFGQFGVAIDEQSQKLEYLRSVSEKTLIPFDSLLTLMQNAKPVAEEYSLTLEQTASMIGKSTERDFGDTAAIQEYFANFTKNYEQAVKDARSAIEGTLTEGLDTQAKSEYLAINYDDITKQAETDAKTYMDAFSAEFLALANSDEYRLNLPIENAASVVRSNRGNEDWKAAKETGKKLSQFGIEPLKDNPEYIKKQLTDALGYDPSLGASGTVLSYELKIEGVDDATENVVKLNETAVSPLNASFDDTYEVLGNVNAQSITNYEYTMSNTIPAMQTETTAANNLADAWNRAAAAKRAYKNA